MIRPQDLDRPAAVLALALAAWGGAVLLGAVNGVFARISPEAAIALLSLATAFAPVALALDAGVRQDLTRRSPRALALALAVLVLVGLGLAGASLRGQRLAPESFSSVPFAVLAYFVGPVGLGAFVALLLRAAQDLRRSAPARSPAARRDAPRASRTSARGAGAAGA